MMENEFWKAGFSDFVLSDGKLWFCDIYYTALLNMDVQTGDVKLEVVLSPKNINRTMQYGPIIMRGGKIIMGPGNADEILIYDMNSKKISSIMLEDVDNLRRKPRFKSVVAYKEEIYFIPGGYPAVVKLDTESLEVDYYRAWVEAANQYRDSPSSLISNSNAVIVDHYCFIQLYKTDVLIKLCLDSGKYEFIRMDRKEYEILSMEYDGENLWMAGFGQKIFRYRCSDGTFQEFGPLHQIGAGIGTVTIYRDELILIPINDTRIYILDKETLELKSFPDIVMSLPDKENMKSALTGCNMIGCKRHGIKYLFAYSTFENKIFQIDLERKMVENYPGILKNEDDIHRLMLTRIYSEPGKEFRENKIGLECFIDYLTK